MISVLLTRSQFENEAFKKHLRSYDFSFFDCPLIEYSSVNILPAMIASFDNIIITSKYAASILARSPHEFASRARFWVVGESSAEILQTAGLNVACVANDVNDLLNLMKVDNYARSIYLSSNEITCEMPKLIKRHIIYNVKYKSQLTDLELKSLSNRIDYAILYSVNSAKTFIKLLLSANLTETLKDMTVITISEKVAKEVLPYFKKIIYCGKGEHKKMIELLISHAETSGKLRQTHKI